MGVPYFSCAVATFGRGALLFLATFAAVSIKKIIFAFCRTFAPFSFSFAVPFSHALPLCPFAYLLPFSVMPFAVRLPKRFQRSFQKVLSRFKRSKFSACTFVHFAPFQAVTWQQTWQNAVIRGRGGDPPWGVGCEAQLSPHRILYFLFPKIFFLENSLSSPASCLPFQCQSPVFWFRSVSAYQQDLVEARICSKKRHFSHFLSKDE